MQAVSHALKALRSVTCRALEALMADPADAMPKKMIKAN